MSEYNVEEYIKRIGDIRSNYDRWSGLGLTPNEAKAFDVAIDAMRKYQKIQDIIEYHMLRFLPKKNMSSFQKDILEVIDNGNDNN